MQLVSIKATWYLILFFAVGTIACSLFKNVKDALLLSDSTLESRICEQLEPGLAEDVLGKGCPNR